MEKQTLGQRMRKGLSKEFKRAKYVAATGAAIGVAYTGVVLAFNLAISPILLGFNGLERALGAEVKTERAVMLNMKEVLLPDGGGPILCAQFDTATERKELCDTYDFLAGKVFPNTVLSKAHPGRAYNLTSLEGPISAKVLSLEEL